MSLKERLMNFFFEDDVPEEKEIFDERQRYVRSRITRRALWGFSVLTALNLLVTELGLRWCESAFAATLVFAAAVRLYWVIANARRGTLYGVHGTAPGAEQACMLIATGVANPLLMRYRDNHYEDFWANFFMRGGLVAEPVLLAASFVLLSAAAVIIGAAKPKKNKEEQS
ncbi:MAG: hypothetical protein NC299_06370 [Lachnospiraceae bacterium]|nr:hypothetical protein [Ruminococcus sp.]MCM1274979.1 hypothetical protein [Lachnospiraceae bacterium]